MGNLFGIGNSETPGLFSISNMDLNSPQAQKETQAADFHKYRKLYASMKEKFSELKENLVSTQENIEKQVNKKAKKKGLGGLIGGIVGGIVGSIIPGVGTALGASLGSSLGGFTDKVVGSIKDKKAAKLAERLMKQHGVEDMAKQLDALYAKMQAVANRFQSVGGTIFDMPTLDFQKA